MFADSSDSYTALSAAKFLPLRRHRSRFLCEALAQGIERYVDSGLLLRSQQAMCLYDQHNVSQPRLLLMVSPPIVASDDARLWPPRKSASEQG